MIFLGKQQNPHNCNVKGYTGTLYGMFFDFMIFWHSKMPFLNEIKYNFNFNKTKKRNGYQKTMPGYSEIYTQPVSGWELFG